MRRKGELFHNSKHVPVCLKPWDWSCSQSMEAARNQWKLLTINGSSSQSAGQLFSTQTGALLLRPADPYFLASGFPKFIDICSEAPALSWLEDKNSPNFKKNLPLIIIKLCPGKTCWDSLVWIYICPLRANYRCRSLSFGRSAYNSFCSERFLCDITKSI